MAAFKISFRLAALPPSKGRGIGFLEGHRELDDNMRTFSSLDETAARELRARMERWISGDDKPKAHFHGWPNDPYNKHCFVFKYQEHRFYGFKCHPKPATDRAFVLCVLCIYNTKHGKHTDPRDLKRVNQWRTNQAATDAIALTYNEYARETNKWKQ